MSKTLFYFVYCKNRGKMLKKFYRIINQITRLKNFYFLIIRVPVVPLTPSFAFCKRVMRAVRPSPDSANSTAACTFGSMEPGAKCPSSMYCFASSTEMSSSHVSSGVPKRSATFSTAVRMIRKSAFNCCARRQLAKSLSITAPTPFK